MSEEDETLAKELAAIKSSNAIFADYLLSIDGLPASNDAILKQFVGKVASISAKVRNSDNRSKPEHRIIPAIVARRIDFQAKHSTPSNSSNNISSYSNSKSISGRPSTSDGKPTKTTVHLKLAYGAGFNLSNSLPAATTIKGLKRPISEPIGSDSINLDDFDSSKSKLSLAAYIDNSKRLTKRVTAKLIYELLQALFETHRMYMTCSSPQFRRNNLGTDKEREEGAFTSTVDENASVGSVSSGAPSIANSSISSSATKESSSIVTQQSSIRNSTGSRKPSITMANTSAVTGFFKSMKGKLEEAKQTDEDVDTNDGEFSGSFKSKGSKNELDPKGVTRFNYRYNGHYSTSSIHNNIISPNNIIITDDDSIKEVMQVIRRSTATKDPDEQARKEAIAKQESDYKNLMANAKKKSQSKDGKKGVSFDGNSTKNTNGMDVEPPKSANKSVKGSDSDTSDGESRASSKASSRNSSRPNTSHKELTSPPKKRRDANESPSDAHTKMEKSKSIGSGIASINTDKKSMDQFSPAGRLPPSQQGSFSINSPSNKPPSADELIRSPSKKKNASIEKWYADREAIITEMKSVENKYNAASKAAGSEYDSDDDDSDDSEEGRNISKKLPLRSGWIDLFPLKLGALLVDITRDNNSMRSTLGNGSPVSSPDTSPLKGRKTNESFDDTSTIGSLGSNPGSSSPSGLYNKDVSGTSASSAWSPKRNSSPERDINSEGGANATSMKVISDLQEDCYFKRSLMLKNDPQDNALNSVISSKIKRLHKDYKDINSNWLFDDIMRLDMAGTGAVSLRNNNPDYINLIYHRFSQYVLNVQRDMRQFGHVVFAILLKRLLGPNEILFLEKVIIVDKKELEFKKPKRKKPKTNNKDKAKVETKNDSGDSDDDFTGGNSDDDNVGNQSSPKANKKAAAGESSDDSSDEDEKPLYGDQRDFELNKGCVKMTIEMLYDRFECPRFHRSISNLLSLLYAPIVLPYNPYAPKPVAAAGKQKTPGGGGGFQIEKRFKYLRFEKYGECIKEFKEIFQEMDAQTRWVKPVFWNPQMEKDRLRVVYERQVYLAESASWGHEDTLERLKEYDYMVWFHMQPDSVRRKILLKKKQAEVSEKNRIERFKLLHLAAIHYWERKEFKKWLMTAFSDCFKLNKAIQKKFVYNLNGRKHVKPPPSPKKEESRQSTANSAPPSRRMEEKPVKKTPEPSPPKNRNVFLGSPTKSVGKLANAPATLVVKAAKSNTAVVAKSTTAAASSSSTKLPPAGISSSNPIIATDKAKLKDKSNPSSAKPDAALITKPGTGKTPSKEAEKPKTADSAKPHAAGSEKPSSSVGGKKMNKHSLEYHEMMKMRMFIDVAFPVPVINKYLNFRQADEILTNNPNFSEFDYAGDFKEFFIIFYKDLTEAICDQIFSDPRRPQTAIPIDESLKALFANGISTKKVDKKRADSPASRAASRAASRRSRSKSRAEMKVTVFDNTSAAEGEAMVFNTAGNTDDRKKWVNPIIFEIRKARELAFNKIENSPIMMLLTEEQLIVKSQIFVVENLFRSLHKIKTVIMKISMAIDFLNEEWIMAVFEVTLTAIYKKYMKDLPNMSKGEGLASNRLVASLRMIKIRKLIKAIWRQTHTEIEEIKKEEKAKKTKAILDGDSESLVDKIIEEQEKAMEMPKEAAEEEEDDDANGGDPKSRPSTAASRAVSRYGGRVSGVMTKQNRREFDLLNAITIDTFTHVNCRHREYRLQFHHWSFDRSKKSNSGYYHTVNNPEFTALSFNVNIDFALSNFRVSNTLGFQYTNITQNSSSSSSIDLHKGSPIKVDISNITALAIVLRHPSNNINRFDAGVHVNNNLSNSSSDVKAVKRPGELVIVVVDNRMPCDLSKLCECLFLHLIGEAVEVKEMYFVNLPGSHVSPATATSCNNFDPSNNLSSNDRVPLVLPYSCSLLGQSTKFYNDGCDHAQIHKINLMVGHLISNASYNVHIYFNNVFAPKIDKVRHKRAFTYYYDFTYKWRADDSDLSLLQNFERFQTRATVPGTVVSSSVSREVAVVYEPPKIKAVASTSSSSSSVDTSAHQSDRRLESEEALFDITYVDGKQLPVLPNLISSNPEIQSQELVANSAPVLALRIHLTWGVPNFNGSTCSATILKRKFVVYYMRARDQEFETGETMSDASLVEEITIFSSKWTHLNNDGEIEDCIRDYTEKKRKSNKSCILSSFTDFVNFSHEIVGPRRGDIENFWVSEIAPSQLDFSAGVGLFVRFYYSISYLTDDGLRSRECKVKVDSSSQAAILLKPRIPVLTKPHKGYSIVKGGLYAKISFADSSTLPQATTGVHGIKSLIRKDYSKEKSEDESKDEHKDMDAKDIHITPIISASGTAPVVIEEVSFTSSAALIKEEVNASINQAESDYFSSRNEEEKSLQTADLLVHDAMQSTGPGAMEGALTSIELKRNALENLEVDFWLSGLSNNLPTMKLKTEPPTKK